MIMQWAYVNLDNPLSQAVPCVVMVVNREVNKAVARPKSGASTSCSGMQAPTEFVLCRRGTQILHRLYRV